MKKSVRNLIFTTFAAAIISAGTVTATAAGAAPGAHRTSLLESRSLFPLRVGADISDQKRDVKFSGGQVEELRTRYYAGYLGYDITPWATIFGTAGGSETSWHGDDRFGDMGFAWSAGMRLALWHLDVRQPAFMAGRLSMSLAGEYARKKSTQAASETKYTEYSGALYIGYEIFAVDPPSKKHLPYSILFFAAPCISSLDGRHTADNQPATDFDEHELFGILGGVEIYIAHNLSVGGQIRYIGKPGFGGSLRYQF